MAEISSNESTILKKPFFRLWIPFAVCFSLSFLMHCKIKDQPTIEILNLSLNDSLTIEAGKYDWLTVDILDADGILFKASIYDAPYSRDQNGTLKNLVVGENAPNPYRIRVSAFLNSELKLAFSIDIENGKSRPIQVLAFNPDAGKDSVPVIPVIPEIPVGPDTTAPVVEITSPMDGQAVNTATLDIIWKVDGKVQTTQLKETFSGDDGIKIITRSATDTAGNTGTHSIQVNFVRKGPEAPTVKSSGTPTREAKPTWTWTSAGGGVGQYQYRLAKEVEPTFGEINDTDSSYTPASPLADGTWHFQVRERDSLGNWGAWSPSATVRIKGSAPAAPTVNRNGSVVKAPEWEWSGGGGGDGTFKYRWKDANNPLGEGTETRYAPSGLSESEHALCVSERDVVGYGAETCQTLTVDRTPPKISDLSPASNHVTRLSSVPVSWKEDGVAKSAVWTLDKEGVNLFTIKAVDEAGNEFSSQVEYYLRPNVIFIREGSSGDGSSWESAFGNTDSAMTPERMAGYPEGTEIWITGGEYTTTKNPSPNLKTGISIWGGFSKSNPENNTLLRSLEDNQTVWTSVNTSPLGIRAEGGQRFSSITIDGVVFSNLDKGIMIDFTSGITIRNCKFINSVDLTELLFINNSLDVKIENCSFANNEQIFKALKLMGGGEVFITDSDFQDNYSYIRRWSGIYVENGKLVVRKSFFRNNYAERDNAVNHIHVSAESTLDYDENQIQNLDGGTISGEPGATIIRGPNNIDIK